MASPINTFKTVTATLTTADQTIYTAPSNADTIVLMAQVANITGDSVNITANHYDGTSVTTELVKDFTVPANDAVGILTGKLVIESSQSFTASASANSSLKLTLSILETI